MGTIWWDSDLEGEQLEFCDLCGRPVPAAERFQSNVETLKGRWICDAHGTLGTEPSYNDLSAQPEALLANNTLGGLQGLSWS